MRHPIEISLVKAAHGLGITYQAAHNLLLCNKLRGRQVNGRWVVTLDSVQSIQREMDSEASNLPEETEQAKP